MLLMSFVSFGVAVRPKCVALLKYSSTSRHAESSAALPRWHSSTTMRSKKVTRELAVDLLPFLDTSNSLVERQVHLVVLLYLTISDPVHHLAEWGEILLHRLVNENIAISK